MLHKGVNFNPVMFDTSRSRRKSQPAFYTLFDKHKQSFNAFRER